MSEHPFFFFDRNGKCYVDITEKGKWFIEHKTEAIVMLQHYIEISPPEWNPTNATAEEMLEMISDIYLVNENLRILREMKQ